MVAKPHPTVYVSALSRLGPEPPFSEGPRGETLEEARERAAAAAERLWLVRLLEKARGDRSAAAREAGLTPRRFETKLREHGLGDA